MFYYYEVEYSKVCQDLGTEPVRGVSNYRLELKSGCNMTARTDRLKRNFPFPYILEDYKCFMKQSFMT
jgi:hypothetical protein